MSGIENQLASLHGDVKSYAERTGQKMTAIQSQLDAIDARTQERPGGYGAFASKSLVERLQNEDSFGRLIRDRKGTARLTLSGNDAAEMMQHKTVLTATGQGFQTTGVMPIQRLDGIVPEARQELTVRNALTARQTTSALVDFVRVSSPMTIASPAAESSSKAENAVAFTATSEKVKTIATWIPASRQILDDLSELAGFIQTSLTYYVNLEEELQLLAGDGTGENLNGLITQSTSFNIGLLTASAGWSRLDILARAAQQLASAKELTPTFVVLNPNDFWAVRLTKDGFGRYILGDPAGPITRPQIWGMDLIATTSISAGTFLMGSGNPAAAEIRDRMELQYEVSTEHADYFTKNLVACRAERRLALVVKRPHSFISGSFSSSPA